jgi:hypothetical protein
MSQGFSSKNMAFAGNGITQIFVNGVVQATTSGSSFDFAVPSGIKSFTVNFDAMLHDNSASVTRIQLGDSGGIETTGYGGTGGYTGLNNNVNLTWDGAGIDFLDTGATIGLGGSLRCHLMNAATNTWCAIGHGSWTGSTFVFHANGVKSLTGELTTVRVTLKGAGDFSGGSVNVQYDNPNPTVIAQVQSGIVVQTVHTQDGEVATGATAIPLDDTIPQITEGAEFMTVSITPTNVASKLRIDVVANIYNAGTNKITIGSIFQDSDADALCAFVADYEGDGVARQDQPMSTTFWMTAGTTSSTTFKFRCGANDTSTITFNGRTAARIFGGVYYSSMTVTEYAV